MSESKENLFLQEMAFLEAQAEEDYLFLLQEFLRTSPAASERVQ